MNINEQIKESIKDAAFVGSLFAQFSRDNEPLWQAHQSDLVGDKWMIRWGEGRTPEAAIAACAVTDWKPYEEIAK